MSNSFSCCRECGTIFQSPFPLMYCPKHRYIDEEQFSKIRDYLEHHPFSNALQISNAMDISTTEVLRYINEGKLVMVDGKVDVASGRK